MKTFYLFSALLLCAACTGENLNSYGGSGEWTDISGVGHDMIVLGEKLDDPYTVSNMTKALQSLYPTKAIIGDVKTTDYYVRFLPKDDNEYHQLETMGVLMIDHPLDYRIVRDGDYYHDPSLDDESITWQYAVVEEGFNFPDGVVHQILDECYIPEHDNTTKSSEIDWTQVEREAFRLTGNEGMLLDETKGGTYSSTSPSGKISIVDDDLGAEPVGVAGVRVACNSFVKIGQAYTDENGNYTIPKSFSTDIRYRLVFKNVKGFSIGFNLLLVPASTSTLGKSSPDGVSVVIDKNSDRKLFCRSVVNNAGYEYYSNCEKDGYSINCPPSNLRIWLFQTLNSSSCMMLQNGALIDNSIISNYLGEYTLLLKMFLPDITLGLRDCHSYADVYKFAIHEFAHASHYMNVGNSYWNNYIKFIVTSFLKSGGIAYGAGTEKDKGFCEVGEMWAYYVQTIMFRERYSQSSVTFGASFWFSPQILLNMDSHGLDRFKLYKALCPEVTTKDAFQDQLISLYPESKSIINQAFNRYE